MTRVEQFKTITYDQEGNEVVTYVGIDPATVARKIEVEQQLSTKMDAPTLVSISEVDATIEGVDNTDYLFTNKMTSITMTSQLGVGSLHFVAGPGFTFTQSEGVLWDGGLPMFETNKIYTVIYIGNTLVSSKGA